MVIIMNKCKLLVTMFTAGLLSFNSSVALADKIGKCTWWVNGKQKTNPEMKSSDCHKNKNGDFEVRYVTE